MFKYKWICPLLLVACYKMLDKIVPDSNYRQLLIIAVLEIPDK